MIYNETKFNSHWNTKKLLELGTFARGKSKHRPRDDARLYEGGGYPLVQTGEVKAANLYITKHEQEYGVFGLAQSKLWDAGTLCITIAANIAETAILGYPMCFPDSVVGFNAYPTESSEQFMHYVFTYIRNSIQNSVSGSIQDNINIEYLSQLDFKVPEKDYQDKIVGVLGAMDQKIETNIRICFELEAMAKTIYDYWFTQFDFPDDKGKPYRSSGGEMVWNEQLKREIPRGWTAKGLGEVCTFRNGINYDKDCIGNRVYRIANVRNITASSLIMDVSDFDEISLPGEQADRYVIKKNDIIIARSGTPGATRLIIDPADNVIFCGFIICCTPNDFRQRLFLTHFLKQLEGTNATKTGGSILQNVSQDTLKSLLVCFPNDVVVDSFNEKIKPIVEMMQNIIIENRELIKLRDWLLPMLMNGQAKVEGGE